MYAHARINDGRRSRAIQPVCFGQTNKSPPKRQYSNHSPHSTSRIEWRPQRQQKTKEKEKRERGGKTAEKEERIKEKRFLIFQYNPQNPLKWRETCLDNDLHSVPHWFGGASCHHRFRVVRVLRWFDSFFLLLHLLSIFLFPRLGLTHFVAIVGED